MAKNLLVKDIGPVNDIREAPVRQPDTKEIPAFTNPVITDEKPTEDPVDTTSTTNGDDTKTAGFMGLPKIAWIAIIGAGLYYAYSKGMFKKLMK